MRSKNMKFVERVFQEEWRKIYQALYGCGYSINGYSRGAASYSNALDRFILSGANLSGLEPFFSQDALNKLQAKTIMRSAKKHKKSYDQAYLDFFKQNYFSKYRLLSKAVGKIHQYDLVEKTQELFD